MDSIIKELRIFAQERNWEKFHTLKNLAMSISIEAAELMEVFQWHNINDPLTYDEVQNVEDEIADIFIYLLMFCDKFFIRERDIIEIIKKKIEKNRLKYPAEK